MLASHPLARRFCFCLSFRLSFRLARSFGLGPPPLLFLHLLLLLLRLFLPALLLPLPLRFLPPALLLFTLLPLRCFLLLALLCSITHNVTARSYNGSC